MQNITVGMPVAIGGVNFKVTSLRPQHDQIICESDAGAMAFFKRDEFLKKIVDSEISLLRSSAAGKLEIVPSSWQATERDGAKAERLKREAILSLEQQLIQAGHSYQSAREKLALHCMERAGLFPVSAPCETGESSRPATLPRWLRVGRAAAIAAKALTKCCWTRCVRWWNPRSRSTTGSASLKHGASWMHATSSCVRIVKSSRCATRLAS